MKRTIGKILAVLIGVSVGASAVIKSMASGGEEMEGSALEEFLQEADEELFANFNHMDYALFLESNVGYGVTLDYFQYGIYGDFTKKPQDGERVYFDLCKALLDVELSMQTHEEWYENQLPHIQNVSEDLQWIVARKCMNINSSYTDSVYHSGKKVAEDSSETYTNRILYEFFREENGACALVNETVAENKRKLAEQDFVYANVYDRNAVARLSADGKLIAVAGSDKSITVYDAVSCEPLHCLKPEGLDADLPMELSQIEGTKEEGWMVFSNGDKTYKMTYPKGDMEKIGEYMFATTYSPDGKYLAYFTGNFRLDDLGYGITDSSPMYEKLCKLNEQWQEIPDGWYVMEVETGNTAYIPVKRWTQDNRPLYGGRCVWIRTERLQKIVDLDAYMEEEG